MALIEEEARAPANKRPCYTPRGKGWVFTINNPTEADRPAEHSEILRLVYQLEEGVNGTPHFQGYVEFKKTVRRSQITKIPFFARANLELRRYAS